ncbi:sensor histidine kinase [Nocardia inohanensis]|uniref:sensor histidine kinase n=1 Tax=Nocardia inohanensis TaxID=209246 RepID=UPI000836F799|nr:histidine kinase [Nocardia inohanensis]
MPFSRASRDLWQAGRLLPLVLTPVLLVVSTFPGEYRVPVSYWVLAMTAAAVFVAGARRPLPVSLMLSALAVPMFLIPAWGLSGLVPFLGAVALVEVVVRSGRGAAALAAVCWMVAVLVGRWGGHAPSFGRVSAVVEAGTYVGLPVLLGLYLRGQRELTASLRARAVEAETRTRAEERTALARELHDLVAHHMASIVLRVKVARQVVVAEPPVAAVLDDVAETATGALTDIRRLLAALRDPVLSEVTLVDAAAIRQELTAAVERVRAAGFTVEADLGASVEGLDAIGRLTLLRLTQESLTNVMKHADRRRTVRITLAQNASAARLEVRSGLLARDPGPGSVPPGHGMIGMRERAELAAGTLSVGVLGREWQVLAELPTATTDLTTTGLTTTDLPTTDLPATDLAAAAFDAGACRADPAATAPGPASGGAG